MPLGVWILSLASVLAWSSGIATPHFKWTPRCQEAYEHLISLRLEEGLATVDQIKTTDPENRTAIFLEDYADFFRFYIHENEESYLNKQPVKRKRLKLLSEGGLKSPYTRYTQAEVLLHWAIARLKFEEYLGAFTDVKRAFSLLETNARLFPDFQPTYKSLGLLQAVIGAIPDKYRWGVQLLGMDGTLSEGAHRLSQLVESSDRDTNPFHTETKLLYAFLQLHLLQDQEAAWETVSSPDFATPTNLTASFVRASVAMHTGHNEQAIQWLEEAPGGPAYEPFYFLDFLLGIAKLRKLETDASIYLKRFLARFEGRHYRKEACQKLGWAALIRGDEVGYRQWMKAVEAEDFAVIDPDWAADIEAKRGVGPHPLLLRARLLYDGGYYEKGLALLSGKRTEDFDRERDQLEFTYRAGRLYQALGQGERAKRFYYGTLEQENEPGYYFPASAALQLGLIFEQEEDAERARYYFKRCLASADHVYKSGLDAQAKSGLERLRAANF